MTARRHRGVTAGLYAASRLWCVARTPLQILNSNNQTSNQGEFV